MCIFSAKTKLPKLSRTLERNKQVCGTSMPMELSAVLALSGIFVIGFLIFAAPIIAAAGAAAGSLF